MTLQEHGSQRVGKQVKHTVTAALVYTNGETETPLLDMKQAVAHNRSVRGVGGLSPLLTMSYFGRDLAGVFSDYMHGVLFGAIRQFTNILFNSGDRPDCSGIPNSVSVLEIRLEDIKAPHLMAMGLRQTSCTMQITEMPLSGGLGLCFTACQS